MEDNIKKLMDKEYHEFTTNPRGFITGFISRRKAANQALSDAAGKSHNGLNGIAETAAFYNRMLNAAKDAFKGKPEEFIKLLEGE